MTQTIAASHPGNNGASAAASMLKRKIATRKINKFV